MIRRKLPEFEAVMMRKSDPIDLFMQWHNYDWPHKLLNWAELETILTDEQVREYFGAAQAVELGRT